MKCGAQAALAVGVGYLLGRRRKMRLATMVAVGAASGGLGKLGPIAVRRGAKYLGSSDIAGALGPQIGEIVDTVRGELLDAAKAAAASAVTSRIDSLSDSLHERAETLRNPEAAVGEAAGAAGEAAGAAGEAAGQAGETVRRAGRTASGTVGRLRRRSKPVEDEEAADFDRDEEQGEEERRNGRARRTRPPARRGTRSQADEYEDDEPRDEYDEEPPEDELDEVPAGEADEFDEEDGEEEDGEEAEAPSPRRRSTTRSPVTRTRR